MHVVTQKFIPNPYYFSPAWSTNHCHSTLLPDHGIIVKLCIIGMREIIVKTLIFNPTDIVTVGTRGSTGNQTNDLRGELKEARTLHDYHGVPDIPGPGKIKIQNSVARPSLLTKLERKRWRPRHSLTRNACIELQQRSLGFTLVATERTIVLLRTKKSK